MFILDKKNTFLNKLSGKSFGINGKYLVQRTTFFHKDISEIEFKVVFSFQMYVTIPARFNKFDEISEHSIKPRYQFKPQVLSNALFNKNLVY